MGKNAALCVEGKPLLSRTLKMMGHCLVIFIFLLFELFFRNKCMSQEEEGWDPHPHQLSSDSSINRDTGRTTMEAYFNKTAFIIPVTGVLLVFALVILYILYSWSWMRKDEKSETDRIAHDRIRSWQWNNYVNEDDDERVQGDSSVRCTASESPPPSYAEITNSSRDNSSSTQSQ